MNVLIDVIGELQAKLDEARHAAIEAEAELSLLRRYADNRKKLSALDVRQIRRMTRPVGPMTQRETADQFRINRGTVSRIVTGSYHAR